MKPSDPLLSQGGAALAAACLVIWSWQHVLHAALSSNARDRRRLAAIEQQVGAIDAMVSASGGSREWLATQQERLNLLKSRLPSHDQAPQLLNTVAETFKAGEVRIIDIAQRNPEPVQEHDVPLTIDGGVCMRLPVTFTVEGRYRAIVHVLQQMTLELFTAVVSVEAIEMRLKDPVAATLEAKIPLSIYMVSPPSGSSPEG